MPALIDTNVLVYRYDSRFPDKQEVATRLLRQGIVQDSVRLAHQTVVEFVAAVSRGTLPIVPLDKARQEAEELLLQFSILYPNAEIVRLACRGSAAYQLGWFDAHMWACAEYYGCETLLSEDFQHNRIYGNVRAVNPFV